MKRLVVLISTALLSAMSFSVAAAPHSKSNNPLQQLNAAWNRQGVEANPTHLKQDTHIVYGGQDISRRPIELLGGIA